MRGSLERGVRRDRRRSHPSPVSRSDRAGGRCGACRTRRAICGDSRYRWSLGSRFSASHVPCAGGVKLARFAPDGRTIVYSAGWDRAPIKLFSTRTDGRDSTRLEFPDADIASVSSRGEIAMLLGQRPWNPYIAWAGTLAIAPLTGGAPPGDRREVEAADWSPDGKSLAIARQVGTVARIEYPIGKVAAVDRGRRQTPPGISRGRSHRLPRPACGSFRRDDRPQREHEY